jgi:N-acetylmuramoyl-L-alanine amidase
MKYLFFLLSFTLLFSAKQVAVLPSSNGFKLEKPLIYLDPGHGGVDLGTVFKHPRCEEKKLNLTTSHYVKRYLEQMGYKVSMTRSRDFAVPLAKRVKLANKARAGVFVSIHYNSCPNATAEGIEIFYNDPKNERGKNSKKLASAVLDKTIFRTQAKSRGVKKGNLFVIRETQMPSVLVEAGFLTNENERTNIRHRDYIDKIAKGIAEGIDRFIKN